MPVSTQLRRNGEPIKVGGWSWWHLRRLHDAMCAEQPEVDPATIPMFPSTGTYGFKQDHAFIAYEDMIWTDGDPGVMFTLAIKAGDEYHAWR